MGLQWVDTNATYATTGYTEGALRIVCMEIFIERKLMNPIMSQDEIEEMIGLLRQIAKSLATLENCTYETPHGRSFRTNSEK